MLRPILILLALTASGLAAGEPSAPPERIARLSYLQGDVTLQGAQEVAPSTLPDRPLVPGDRLATGRDGRAELGLGNATLRLDESTSATVADLGASDVRLELTAGTASLHLRELSEDERFEVVTLNTTIAFRMPGEYRIDITPSGATELSVRAGNAEVATAGGPVRVADGQRVRLEGRAEFASLVTPRSTDDFDDWVLEREVQFADVVPQTDETLDDYGDWYDDPSYGQVWMPSYAYGGYDPFSYGYWQRSGFGYSWYDPMPWSPYTYYGGHWTYLDSQNRWAWVSQQRQELRQRAARTDRQLDRVLEDSRPVGRANAGEIERRAEAVSSGLGRRIDADRQPVLQRNVEPAKTPRSAAAPPRSAPSGQSGATPTVRPSRPASSNSSGSSSSQAASRAAATATAAKGALANPQDP